MVLKLGSLHPDSLINSDKKEILADVFKNAVNGAVETAHGKLLNEMIIEFKGYPGREIRIDFQNGTAVITMRLYLIKNKMYMLETITVTDKDFNTSIKKFMNSFDLLR